MPITVNEDLRLRRLARFVSDQDHVLDVGFAQMPNRFLANASVTGIDVIKAEKPPNYHRVVCQELEGFAQEYPSTFQGIVAGEILEHLENPIGFLRVLHDLLVDDGVLALSTPNPHSIIETMLTLFLSRRWFYTQDHVTLYPQRWLIRMLELAGFTQVRLYSGGMPLPGFGLLPFPRPLCHQTIAVARKEPGAHFA